MSGQYVWLLAVAFLALPALLALWRLIDLRWKWRVFMCGCVFFHIFLCAAIWVALAKALDWI